MVYNINWFKYSGSNKLLSSSTNHKVNNGIVVFLKRLLCDLSIVILIFTELTLVIN